MAIANMSQKKQKKKKKKMGKFFFINSIFFRTFVGDY